jgi:hypothetical protein
MKIKLDKEIKRENLKTFCFSSLKQFNALQIKPICFNCLTKRLSKQTFSYICIKKHGHVSQF